MGDYCEMLNKKTILLKMKIILLIILLTGALCTIYNPRKGITILLLYILLVPYSSFKLFGLNIEFNYITGAILFIFTLKHLIIEKKIMFNNFEKLLFLFSLSIISISLLSSSLPLLLSLNYIKIFLLSNLAIPIILNRSCENYEDLKYILKALIFSYIIMLIYSFACFIIQDNPYINFMSEVFDVSNANLIFLKHSRFELKGKLQSTLSHPMTWSILNGLLLILSITTRKLISRYTYYIIILLSLINTIIINVRSGIYAILIALSYLLIMHSNKARLIKYIYVYALSFITLFFVPAIYKYINIAINLININNFNQEGGSTLSMRYVQISEAIRIAFKTNAACGLGFGWCVNYRFKHGDHPLLLSFESAIIQILIDSGITGLILWLFLFLGLINIGFRRKCYIKNEIIALFILYISYILFTGIFSLNFFLIVFILLCKYNNYILINQSNAEHSCDFKFSHATHLNL